MTALHIGNHIGAGIQLPAAEADQIRELADRIAKGCRGYAAVFAPKEGGYGYCLVSRSEDLSVLGKALTASLSGRGGGKAAFQQGSVAATKADIEAFFEKADK